MKISMGCGVFLVILGIMTSVVIVTRILAEYTRFDIASILCVIGLLTTSSFLIIPGAVLAIRGNVNSIIAILCAIIGMSMLYTIIGFLYIYSTAGRSAFEDMFFNSLLPLLGLGLFGGIVTTCFAYGYIDTMRGRHAHDSL